MLKNRILEIGRIENYKIESFLGDGNKSSVFIANQESLAKYVALKVIEPEVTNNREILEILSFSTQAISKINHPNIVSVFDAGIFDGIFFIVMHYIKGKTLEKVVSEMGPLPAVDVLFIAKEISKALEVAHSKEIFHLNIKPSNIFITDQEEIKISDFGIVFPIDGVNEVLAHKELVLGHPWFISPESIMGKGVDHRSDFYSLGSTLFFLLTGDPIYKGKSIEEILEKHVYSPVPSLRSYLPNIPESVERLVSSLLSKDPDLRPNNSRELIDILEVLVKDSNKISNALDSEISTEIEEFLLNRIAKSAEERMYIQDMLEGIANYQKQKDVPEEARNLMDKIILEEFSKRFNCPPEIIDKLRNCKQILENPAEWINKQMEKLPKRRSKDTASKEKVSKEEEKSFKGRSYNVTNEPKSKIIKSSQIISETFARNTMEHSKRKNKISMPTPPPQKLAHLDPVLEEAVSSISKYQAKSSYSNVDKTGEKSGSKFAKFLLFFLLMGSMAFLGYLFHSNPDSLELVKTKLAEWGLLEKQKVVVIKKEKIKYPKLEKELNKLLKEHNFHRATLLVKKQNIPIKDKENYTKKIALKAKKTSEKIPEGTGWFGEKLPYKLKREPTVGVYVYKFKDSISYMSFVPEGNFLRGSYKGNNNEKPVKKIWLSNYYIDKYELSNEEFEKFLLATGAEKPPYWENPKFNLKQQPVVGITWYNAASYAKWCGKRLPTEAEWEKSAKGGIFIPDWKKLKQKLKNSEFKSLDNRSILIRNPLPMRNLPWCNMKQKVENLAKYSKSQDRTSSVVGSFPDGDSPYLCSDMAGNVIEWCSDYYSPNYYAFSSITKNPKGPSQVSKNLKSCRGGSWESPLMKIYCFHRIGFDPRGTYYDVGVRLALDAAE